MKTIEQQLKALEKATAPSRKWFYYPIVMPLNKDGYGPATIGKDAVKIVFEVWDQACTSYGSFDFLPDAIDKAIELNIADPDGQSHA